MLKQICFVVLFAGVLSQKGAKDDKAKSGRF